MNIKKLSIILTIILMFFILSCGKNKEQSLKYLSGHLEIEEDVSGPAFVAISRTEDIEEIKKDPRNSMVIMVTADPLDHSYSIDLSDTNLLPGEEIFIFGFVDNDYDDGIPNPTVDDFVGFYFDSENWKTSYTLKGGDNSGIDFKINRRVYDFKSEIKGTVNGNYSGDLMLIAYAGDLNSFDLADFDIDSIIGYKILTKDESPLPYTLGIMPYGFDMPIRNVFIIALLDRNLNGIPDAGDIIGFHSESAGNYPALVTIDRELITNKYIDMTMEIAEPSGYKTPVTGVIEMPEGSVYDVNSKPLYLIFAQTDDLNKIMNDPVSTVKYFKKIDPPEKGAKNIKFEVYLSGSDLKSGDDIFIISLWDRDFVAGLPCPGTGDYIGFYIDSAALSPTYMLKDDSNQDIHLKVNRKIYSFDAEINGSIIGDDMGELTIIAYTGNINSLDFQNALDYNAIIGYQRLTKNERRVNYSLKILPYGLDVPIRNVYIIAMLDKNRNGKADGGDKIGFYTENNSNLPALLTIDKGLSTNKHIETTLEIPEPSGYDVPIFGTLTMPSKYNTNSEPLYIIIADTNDPDKILEDPFRTIKYIEKIEPPGVGKNEIDFEIDLSQTNLRSGDEIIILALWDRNSTSGFPLPDEGDYIGFYVDMNITALRAAYQLQDWFNESIDFDVSRRVYDFQSRVTGTIRGKIPGEVTIIAYALSLDLFNLEIIKPDSIVGYQKIKKGTSEIDYTLNIFPYGHNLPINYVFLIALLDKDENGTIDYGDYIGYHTAGILQEPIWFTIDDEKIKEKNIKMIIPIITNPYQILSLVLDIISTVLENIFG